MIVAGTNVKVELSQFCKRTKDVEPRAESAQQRPNCYPEYQSLKNQGREYWEKIRSFFLFVFNYFIIIFGFVG